MNFDVSREGLNKFKKNINNESNLIKPKLDNNQSSTYETIEQGNNSSNLAKTKEISDKCLHKIKSLSNNTIINIKNNSKNNKTIINRLTLNVVSDCKNGFISENKNSILNSQNLSKDYTTKNVNKLNSNNNNTFLNYQNKTISNSNSKIVESKVGLTSILGNEKKKKDNM